jgi:hypothetical protein
MDGLMDGWMDNDTRISAQDAHMHVRAYVLFSQIV